MSGIHLLLVVCVSVCTSVQAYNGNLTNCDDCSTIKIALNNMRMHFHDISFGAYQVVSNGYICLFEDDSGPSEGTCYGNKFTPIPITQLEGPYVVIPFWNDIELDAAGIIIFGEHPMDPETLRQIQEETGTGFNPDYYVRVLYANMRGYQMSIEKRNTFEVVIATETENQLTRIILHYEGMQWIKEVPPTVGYGDGDCRGEVGFRAGEPTTPEEMAYKTLLFDVDTPLAGPRCEGKHN